MLDSAHEGPLAPGGFPSLSPRELEVLARISEGQTNAEVAAALGVTVHAVKFHLASIFGKLDVKNRTEAAVLYLRDADHSRITG